MKTATDHQISFLKGWEGLPPDKGDGNDLWEALRGKGLARFKALGLPTRKDEEWKYTDLSPVFKKAFHPAPEGRPQDDAVPAGYVSKEDFNMWVVNGRPARKTTAALPAGISILSLREAAGTDGEVRRALERVRPEDATAFAALNQGLAEDGLVILVAARTICEKLIHIIHVKDYAEDPVLASPRTVILAGAQSEATVLESHVDRNTGKIYLTNALADVEIGENAVLHYIKSQDEDREACHIDTTRVRVARGANFQGFTLTVGGALVRNNLEIVVEGEGANATLNGLYALDGTQHVDNHTFVDHRTPNGTSNQLYKGILNGQSHAVFNGKIIVRDVAQQTNSYQLNKNLILGQDCHVDTKPQLEIFADDVKCTHGATIGQLNEDELFYLQTRAVPRPQAVTMLARGFVDDILDTIKSAAVRDKLHRLLEPTFSAIKG